MSEPAFSIVLIAAVVIVTLLTLPRHSMSFSMRRVVVVTSRINPPINNMQWRASLGGEDTGLFGLGATEPEAVLRSVRGNPFREAKAEEEQQEAGE